MIVLLLISSTFSKSNVYDYDLNSFRNDGPYKYDYTNYSIIFNAKTVPNASSTGYNDCNVVLFSDGEYTCYGRMKDINYYLSDDEDDEDGVEIWSRVGYEMEAAIFLICSNESNLTVVEDAFASYDLVIVEVSSPYGCYGSGPGLPKAETAKCEKPVEVVIKYGGVKQTIEECKTGCFATEYDEEGYNATSCVECSYVTEESECNSYDTCHYSNGNCRTNTCMQWAKDVKKEADDVLAECLKEADEYEEDSEDEKTYCHFEHDHPGRLASAEVHKVDRLICHRLYGCMYNKDKARCSSMTVWSFIVALAVSISVVLITIVIVVVICCCIRKKRGDYGAINDSD